jgi:PRTRC genetic system protein E
VPEKFSPNDQEGVLMFKELAPYLRQRAVLLTVTHLEDEQIRVNIVPQKLKDGENAALTTPLTVSGSAEELDRELPATVINFVSAHLELKNTLEQAKAEMDAAAKEAQAEARKKSKTTGAKIETNRVIEKPERLPPQADPPKSPGLFDSSPPATEAKSETNPMVATVHGISDEDQAILDEIRENEETAESRTEYEGDEAD